MAITIEELGITQDELQERVVSQLCDRLLSRVGFTEEGEEDTVKSTFANTIEERCRKHVSETIARIAETYLNPNVKNFIENLTLQETTKWGEKKSPPVSFIEYLVGRADAYMREEVNYQGKSRDEGDSYSWSKSTTRIAYMVKSHLHYSIETAMKQALATANASIVGGLEGAVKVALEQLQSKLKVAVTTG